MMRYRPEWNIPDIQRKIGRADFVEHLPLVWCFFKESMPKDKNNVPFYVKHGFSVMENGAAIQICNYSNAQ